MTRSIVLGAFALTTLVAAFASVPAAAQATREIRSISVDLSDLNLVHSNGLAAAHRRIRNAADEVCGGAPDLREVRAYDRYAQCMEETQRAPLASLERFAKVQLASNDATAARPSR